MYWALGCGVLGALMLALGIHAAATFRAPGSDSGQVITLGQMVDIITASALLIVAALITVGQWRARRRSTQHKRWVKEHPLG